MPRPSRAARPSPCGSRPWARPRRRSLRTGPRPQREARWVPPETGPHLGSAPMSPFAPRMVSSRPDGFQPLVHPAPLDRVAVLGGELLDLGLRLGDRDADDVAVEPAARTVPLHLGPEPLPA